MRHFLLVYDAIEDRLAFEPREFDDLQVAYGAFCAMERRFAGTRTVVTLIGADSLETVKVTHRNFFERDSLAEALAQARAELGIALAN